MGLCAKIARLVEERGWNLDEFARNAKLHRLTVRNLFLGAERRLHNATVGACARALGVTVTELRNWPLERLLPKMHRVEGNHVPPPAADVLAQVSQPELLGWMERNPERAAQLTPEEREELLSLQGVGGPLTAFGVAHFVDLIERKRRLKQKVAAVAGTEYLDLLEQMVELMYEKIQPYRDR